MNNHSAQIYKLVDIWTGSGHTADFIVGTNIVANENDLFIEVYGSLPKMLQATDSALRSSL